MKSKNRFHKAKNPHNQFIFEYFTNLKMKCMGTGRDKLVFGYQKILGALQRYPMPILTEDQAMQIQGVGPKTSCMIVKLLNQAYKDDQNVTLEMNEALLADTRLEECSNNSCPTTFDFRPNEVSQTQRPISKQQTLFILGFSKPQKMVVGEDPYTQVTQQYKGYVPPKNSKGWAIMLALQKFEEERDKSFASRREIREGAKKLQIEIPNWTTIDTLEKHNLVSKSILGDDLKYALTEGGREVAAKFSQEYQLEQRNLRDAGLAEESQDDYTKAEIILLIDNRERYQSTNRTIIFEKLSTIYGLNCRLASLPVGDFLWIAKIGKTEYVLEYIVERKTVSDLAHSIIDKRYNDQKFKLKNCGLTRLFYLIENGSSNNLSVSRQAIEKAIRNTQVRDGFLVQQTESLEESLHWISTLTKLIKVTTPPFRTLSEFMTSNSSRAQTVQHQWGCMVKAITGAGQEAARVIVERWPTPIRFYEELNKAEDKLALLQGRTSESKSKYRITAPLAKLLEVLFTYEEYPDTNFQSV